MTYAAATNIRLAGADLALMIGVDERGSNAYCSLQRMVERAQQWRGGFPPSEDGADNYVHSHFRGTEATLLLKERVLEYLKGLHASPIQIPREIPLGRAGSLFFTDYDFFSQLPDTDAESPYEVIWGHCLPHAVDDENNILVAGQLEGRLTINKFNFNELTPGFSPGVYATIPHDNPKIRQLLCADLISGEVIVKDGKHYAPTPDVAVYFMYEALLNPNNDYSNFFDPYERPVLIGVAGTPSDMIPAGHQCFDFYDIINPSTEEAASIELVQRYVAHVTAVPTDLAKNLSSRIAHPGLWNAYCRASQYTAFKKKVGQPPEDFARDGSGCGFLKDRELRSSDAIMEEAAYMNRVGEFLKRQDR